MAAATLTRVQLSVQAMVTARSYVWAIVARAVVVRAIVCTPQNGTIFFHTRLFDQILNDFHFFTVRIGRKFLIALSVTG